MSPGVLYTVAAIALLLGAGMLWAGASRLLVIRQVSGDGQNTAAVITSWEKKTGKMSDSVRLHYTYQAGAQSYQGEDALPASASAQHGVGGTVDITYSRQHPEHSVLSDNVNTSGAIISLVFGLVFVGSGVSLLTSFRPVPGVPTPDVSKHPTADTEV